MSMIISEAFRKLEFLSEDTFELNDDGIDELKSFIDSDEEDDTVNIIDPEAESEEEIKDSYLGKVILDCAVCHSKIYKDADEVTIEDGEELANTSEECPYCYTTDGYKVVGQVANYKPLDDVKVEVEDEDGDGQAEAKVEVKADESLKSRKSHKGHKCHEGLNESFEYDYIELCCDACDCEWTDDLGGVEDEDELYYLVSNGEVTCPECGSNEVSVISIEGADDDYDDYDESLKEGIFDFGKKKKLAAQKQKEAEKARKQAEKEREEEEERQRGADVAKSWKEREARERQAKSDYERSRYNGIKGSNASNTGKSGVHYSGGDYYSESISESFDEIALTADGQKITVKSEPVEQSTEFAGEETVAPVSQEIEDEIVANNEGEADVDVDEFSEEDFDELGEGYLKEVYDNVKSYKTTGVTSKGNSIKLEGVITFTSGKQKQTQFVFEAKDITKKGKARFIGENKQICRGNKAFTLTGSIKSGKFLAESFNYNYRANGSKRVYGTIKRK